MGSREQGFALTGYLAIAGVVVFLLMAAAIKIQSSRLASEQQAHATTRASLAIWKGAAETCSSATEQAKKEADKRQSAAQAALKQARAAAAKGRTEIERLKAQRAADGPCPAGQAVEHIRRGIVP